MTIVKKALHAVLVPVMLIALWWVLSTGSTSPYFPPLRDILEAFRANWLFERVGSDVVPSLVRMLAGYGLALVIGIGIGIPLGLVHGLRSALEPAVEYLRALPVVALIPLFIVATGIGDLTKVLVIALGAVWPILLNTQDGVGSVEPELGSMSLAYRLTLRQRIWHIVLPSALPQIFAGARTALAISFIVMVISEMLAATNGIGYFVLQAQSSFAITDMWSGIILLGILGYVFNLLFLAVQSRVLRWHVGYQLSSGRVTNEGPPAAVEPEGNIMTTRPSTVLSVRSLAKVYGSGTNAVRAINDVSFDVAEGEYVSIVGPSGAGKTTLLKCLSGLLPITSGAAEFLGSPISGPPEGLALVFQDYSRSLAPWMSVYQNVELPLKARRMGRTERRARAMEALEGVGLGDRSHQYPWQMSGGMQQRVAIARGLASRPRLLMMDEPMASVDAQTRADLEDLVLSVRARFHVTLLLVTHDIDESVYVGDRVVVLSNRPTQVREIVTVDLDEPHDQISTKSDPRFLELRSRVYSAVREERAPLQRQAFPDQDRGEETEQLTGLNVEKPARGGSVGSVAAPTSRPAGSGVSAPG